MKYTFCITGSCNLRCTYCYIAKNQSDMTPQVAKKAIDFMYATTPVDDEIKLGFFGGEPLLRFTLIQEIMALIEDHPRFRKERTQISIVTNGTILTDDMIDFINRHGMVYCLSCDGPPEIHNLMRRFRDGRGSGEIVERNLLRAKDSIRYILVNAVYYPQSLPRLPEIVRYFSSLGLRKIFLNPDFSAPWSADDIALLPEIYAGLGDLYVDAMIRGDPHVIGMIDSKIAVILHNGYAPDERCRMGTHEFAFAPSGRIYPCERLIGADDGKHAIGSVLETGDMPPRCRCMGTVAANPECTVCSLRKFCMNWCGCSNFFQSGSYDRTGPFLCASEKAAITTAMESFRRLSDEFGPDVLGHLSGIPCTR